MRPGADTYEQLGSVCDNRAMAYELWDTETRNIVNTFESECEAREAARELIAVNPGVYPGALVLLLEDESGETTMVASGSEFVTPE
jgi:hypothetical protein